MRTPWAPWAPGGIHVYSSREFIYIFLCPETLLHPEFETNGWLAPRKLSSHAWLLLAMFSKVDGNNCEQKQSKGVWATCSLSRKEKEIKLRLRKLQLRKILGMFRRA